MIAVRDAHMHEMSYASSVILCELDYGRGQLRSRLLDPNSQSAPGH